MAKIIRRSQIPALLDYLEKNYLVIAPIKKEGSFVFEIINPYYSRPSQIHKVALNYPTTILPPDKVALFPPKELMFDFNREQGVTSRDQRSSIENLPPQVLFAVHDYDIRAINLLDKIMTHPTKDYYYLCRRKKTIIIGIEHKREKHHFDHHFQQDIEAGFDLFLNPIENFYIVTVGSKIGEKLTKLPIFEDSEWKIQRKKEQKDDILFSPKTAKIIENSKNSKIWDKLAEICFGCGICSYVCPLCYCFETEDIQGFCDKKSCRYRRWDACFLPAFWQMAGGNPKEKLRDRIYNWYHHKFVRMPEEYDHPGCVGCGRCILECPAKINFREYIDKLIKESEK